MVRFSFSSIYKSILYRARLKAPIFLSTIYNHIFENCSETGLHFTESCVHNNEVQKKALHKSVKYKENLCVMLGEKMDIELDIAQPTPEENELLENDLLVADNVSGATSFETIGLFAGEKWRGVRYYLTQMNACFTIYDLIDRRDSIVEELFNLGVMDHSMINEFDRLLAIVVKDYHL